MSEGTDIVFDFVGNGKPSGMTITARLGDSVLACDSFDIAKAKSREEFVTAICKDRPGLDRSEIERLLLDHAATHARKYTHNDEKSPQPDAEHLLLKMPPHARDAARAMVQSPNLMQSVISDVQACGVAGEKELIAILYLAGVSRLLRRPLAVIVQAPSSCGKSYTTDKTTALFPPESVIHATDMTAQALYYMPPGSLRHKFVVAGERSRREDDESADATKALREMIGSGRLSKLVAVKQGGRIVTERIEQPGPIAFCESTTAAHIFNEDMNRSLLVSADERQQQTERVVNCLAESYSGGAVADTAAIIEKHHALQRMLQQHEVIIPYAPQIAARFDTERVEARRAYPHLMGMIQAVALLHQFQRQIDSADRIVANVDDYQIARHLTRGPLSRLLGGHVSDAALRFHERLAQWAGDQFTTTEAVRRDRKSKQAISGWLNDLCDAGAVEQVEPRRGNRPAIWRLTAMDHADLAAGDSGLPDPAEISV